MITTDPILDWPTTIWRSKNPVPVGGKMWRQGKLCGKVLSCEEEPDGGFIVTAKLDPSIVPEIDLDSKNSEDEEFPSP